MKPNLMDKILLKDGRTVTLVGYDTGEFKYEVRGDTSKFWITEAMIEKLV